MGYVTIFATQVVTAVARDCFSRSVVGRGNVWRPGVAAEKTPRKIGFRAWPRGFLDCMADMLFLLCRKFP